MSIVEQLREITEKICDKYCKYGDEAEDEKLTEICESCPLNKIE